jgi:parallel beta-helix repeat protein
MIARKLIAFMSYAHTDDADDRLTTFRDRLSREVKIQTGEDFPIFQDREHIRWGDNWQERVDGSLDEVTFLIAILSPSFLRSAACREELSRFLEREKKLKRDDLILPVYYVDCPTLNDEGKRKADPLAQELAKRQYADWRELRFEPFTSPQVCKRLARLAGQVRDALESQAQPPTAAKASAHDVPRPEISAASASEFSQSAERFTRRTEPPTRIVDPLHRGDFSSISDAIRAAKPGDRILVRPGLYKEGLVMDKPLEIVGDGDRGDVVVEARGSDALLFQANMGRVVNLTLRQTGGGDWYGVDIAQGRLELEGCDITSQSLSCVAIHNGADPRLRRNRIHDGKSAGVLIYEDGQGTLEDNEIFGNTDGEIAIKTGGNPVVRRNRIHDGGESGVYIHENGEGTLEDNEIFGHALPEIAIRTGGNPVARRNRIHDGISCGVHIYENGQGTLEDNDIFGNARAGVEVRVGGNPIVRSNRINKNRYEGVWIYEGGRGVVENNDLRGNAKGSSNIAKDCLPNIKWAGNLEDNPSQGKAGA